MADDECTKTIKYSVTLGPGILFVGDKKIGEIKECTFTNKFGICECNECKQQKLKKLEKDMSEPMF